MKNNIQRFYFPARVQEAARLLGRLKSKAVVVGGGTRLPSVLPAAVEAVIDLSDLPLKYVKADKKWLRIGALCTLAQLEAEPLLKGWAGGVISVAAGFGASAVIRSMGTVGGNIVRAYPYNNLPPVFLALGAQVAFTDGAREEAASYDDFQKPKLGWQMGSRYLVTEVRVPAETKTWAAAASRIAGVKTDWVATANCAVAVDKKDGVCRKAAIALGALLPRATRFKKAESVLESAPCGDASARAAEASVAGELSALLRATAANAYASEVAAVLVRRSLLEAFNN